MNELFVSGFDFNKDLYFWYMYCLKICLSSLSDHDLWILYDPKALYPSHLIKGYNPEVNLS